MSPGAAPANDFTSRFLAGFDQSRNNLIIQELMKQLGGVFDPVRSTNVDLPQQPKPDMSRVGQPGGGVPQFFNSNIPNPVTTEAAPGRTDIAQRLMGAIGNTPEGLGIVEKMFGDYFKPGTPVHFGIPEGGAAYVDGKILPGPPKQGTVAPGAATTVGGRIVDRNAPNPVSVAPGNALVQPSATPGAPAAPVYQNNKAAEASMFTVESDNDGNVTVIRKDTGETKSLGKIGKATAGPARYHYGANAKGELVQVDTITGEQKTIPGVFGPEYLKMTFDQRNQSTDQLYSKLLEKFMAGQASQAELETLNMLTDMKAKQGILYMLQGASETGKLAGPPPRPWEQPKETPPAPEKKGALDFLRPNAPDVTITPDTSGRPKFRQPGKEAPSAGAAYKFSVGKESYSLRGPSGKTPDAIKADVDQIGEALKAGVTINEILAEFEKNGYTVTRPGAR